MKDLIYYLDPERVFFIDINDKNDVIKNFSERLYAMGAIKDPEQFYNLVLIREKEVSTVIGHGAAIPHLKIDSCEKFFISIGILKSEITWDEYTQQKVKIVFLIAGPDDKHNEYLSILSMLSALIQNSKKLEKLKNITTAKEFFSIVNDTTL